MGQSLINNYQSGNGLTACFLHTITHSKDLHLFWSINLNLKYMTQVAKMGVSNPLITMSVKDFMVSNGFNQVYREVRENTNGYPYITFINKSNKAENIYFSKRSAETVKAGQEIKKGFFDNLLIAETTNADGEKRIKIVSAGSSERLEVEVLF